MKYVPFILALQLVVAQLLFATFAFSAQLAIDTNPSVVKPGGKINAAFTVSNPDTSPLTNVELHMRYPDHLLNLDTVYINKGSSLNTVICDGTYETLCVPGDNVIWNLGDIPPQSGISVDMLPTVLYGTTEGALIQFEAELWIDGTLTLTTSKTVTVQAQPFFQLTVDQTATPANTNGETEYIIKYSHIGTNSAGTQLNFPLPEGSTYVSATNSGAVVDDVVTWQLGSMQSGQIGEQRVTVATNGNEGELLKVDPVTIQGTDSNYILHQVQVSKAGWLRNIESGELSIALNSDPARPLQFYQGFHVSLSASNPNTTSLSDVEIHLRYPENLPEYSTQFISKGGQSNTVVCYGGYETTCEPGDIVVWSLGTIPPKSSITVDMRPTIPLFQADGTLIQFDAELWVNGQQILSTSRSVAVQAEPFFELSVDANTTPVKANGETDYRIKYSHIGSISSNTQLSFPLPKNSTFLSATNGGTLAGRVVTWQLGSMQNGDTGEQRITIATNGGDGELIKVDPITISGTDSNYLIHEVRATKVGWIEDIESPEFSLTLSKYTIRHLEEVRVALTVTNPGTTPLSNVQIYLDQPALLTAPAPAFITTGSSSNSVTRIAETNNITTIWDLGTIPPKSGITVNMLPQVHSTTGQIADGTLLQLEAELQVAGEQIATTSRSIAVQSEPFFELFVDQDTIPAYFDKKTEYRMKYSTLATYSTDTQLTFPLPDDTTFVSATDGGILSDGVVSWQLGDTQNGDTGEQRVIVATNGNEGELLLADQVKISGKDSSYFVHEVQAAKEGWLSDIETPELSLTVNPDPVRPNEELHIALTASNREFTPLSNVELRLRYPIHLYETSAFTTGGSANTTSCASTVAYGLPCNTIAPGDIFIWNIGTIPPEGGITVDMLSVVADEADGTLIQFDAELWVDGRQMLNTNKTVAVKAEPAFELTIDKDESPVNTDKGVEYTLNYSVPETTSNQTRLSFQIPEDAGFVRASDGGTVFTGKVIWELGNLESGAGGQVKVTTYKNDGVGSTQLIDPAIITGQDPSTAMNTALASTASFFKDSPKPDVYFTISPTPVLPNSDLDVSLTIENYENLPFSNIELLLLYPDHLGLFSESDINTGAPGNTVNCSYPSGACGNFGETILWNLGTLLPGQNITVSIPPMVEYGTAAGTMIPFHAELRVDGRQVMKLSETVMVGSNFQFAGAYPPGICGDVSSDNDVGLKDLILLLQGISGRNVPVSLTGECNGDMKLDMIEVFEILNLLK